MLNVLKLNISLGQPPLNGYWNIDPLAPEGSDKHVRADPNCLDGIVDNNECEEVLAQYTLDFIPLQARFQVLTHWMSKVAHGGMLILTCLNINELARLIHLGQIADSQSITANVFGPCTNIWLIRKSVTTVDDTIGMIRQGGQFDVEKVVFDGLMFTVVARRK
jgi:hypothetical protein